MLAKDPAARPNIWQLLKSECLLSKELKQITPVREVEPSRFRAMREKIEELKDHLSILAPSPPVLSEVPLDNSSYVVQLQRELGHLDLRHTVVGSHLLYGEEPSCESMINSVVEVVSHIDEEEDEDEKNEDRDDKKLDHSSSSHSSFEEHSSESGYTRMVIELEEKDDKYLTLDQSPTTSSSDGFTKFAFERQENNEGVGDCPTRKKKTRIGSAFKKMKKLFG